MTALANDASNVVQIDVEVSCTFLATDWVWTVPSTGTWPAIDYSREEYSSTYPSPFSPLTFEIDAISTGTVPSDAGVYSFTGNCLPTGIEWCKKLERIDADGNVVDF